MNCNKILFIYSCLEYPTRSTIWDNIYALEKYSGDYVFYYNIAFREPIKYITKLNFDMVVFHHSVTAPWNVQRFTYRIHLLKEAVKHINIRVAFFQDEHLRSLLRCQFINELGITHVFSVTPQTEWKKIYRTVDFDKVSFFPILCGYINEDAAKRLEKRALLLNRSIGIGYRTAANNSFALGRFGFKKEKIADVFIDNCIRYGIKHDIKKGLQNMLLDKAWYSFLLNCKYTIGVESGSSVLDEDGQINQCITKYLAQNPTASFPEVEKACFLGLDGNIRINAISPRHLEACITRTCQILVEGKYNDILQPWVHYIPLKEDFSNVNEVMEIIKKDTLREGLVNRAYKDVVESNKYSYGYFVKYFYHSLGCVHKKKANRPFSILHTVNIVLDALSWLLAAIYSTNVRIKRKLNN